MTDTIHLGLIGDNIGKSLSPRLHGLAAAQNNRAVVYERLIPAERGVDFDALFDTIAAGDYRGVNVTYPYKEQAARRVTIGDPLVRAIGAVNTVLFDDGGPHGFNTDYTGFIAAYRRIRGETPPGPVLMIGAGGVGKAIAFALVALGLEEIRIADRDLSRASALADALKAERPGLIIRTGSDTAALAAGAGGLVNCTPVGMIGYDGTPLERTAMTGAAWVFDAVYTPLETRFLKDAAQEGLQIISGYELFIGQGVDAWRIFTGLPVDEQRLREALDGGEGPAA